MSPQKPRILNNNRDMALSLIPLLLVCLVLAAIYSSCSFSPGGAKEGPVPSFDIDDALGSDAHQLNFPIRNPHVPDGWKPNSGSRGTVEGKNGGVATTVGYITPDGRYMQMTQSSASEESLVPFAVGGDRTATGVQQIGDQKWVQYADQGVEPVWVSDFGAVRILIRGAGTNDQFTELAGDIGKAVPLQKP